MNIIGAFIIFVLLILMVSKAWRFFIETSDDIRHIRLLEPWYWFVFLNLVLTIVTSNYDYQFILIGLLIQLALAAWFAVSIGWIIQSCHHKTAIQQQSWYVRGKSVKFCYRCGTRLPRDFHAVSVIKDSSWQNFLFQVPPHLFEYATFWVAQSLMVLITLFLALKFLKSPDFQHKAVLVAVVLVILVPILVYFLGRFRRYLSETKGMIWWEDLRSSFLSWAIVIALVWALLHFL